MGINLGALLTGATQARSAYLGGQQEGQQNAQAQALKMALLQKQMSDDANKQRLAEALGRANIGHLNAETHSLENPQDKWEKVETDNGIYEWNPRTHETRRMLEPEAPPPTTSTTPPPQGAFNGPTGDIDLNLPDRPDPLAQALQQGAKPPAPPRVGLQPKKTPKAPTAQQHIVDPVTGKVVFFDPTQPPADLKVNPTPVAPTIISATTPEGQPRVFRVPKEGGDATPVGGITPNPSGGQGAATIKTKTAENRALLRTIQETVAAVKKNPTAFGVRNVLGDAVNQIRDPAGVGVRAMVANVGSMKIHERNGSAVSPKEFQRTAPFVPSDRDQSGAIIDKLTKMAHVIEQETEELERVGGPALQSSGSATPSTGSGDPEFDAMMARVKKRTP